MVCNKRNVWSNGGGALGHPKVYLNLVNMNLDILTSIAIHRKCLSVTLMIFDYTPGIYADGVYSFRLFVRMFVSSLVTFCVKVLVKVYLVVYISYTNGQKSFVFAP